MIHLSYGSISKEKLTKVYETTFGEYGKFPYQQRVQNTDYWSYHIQCRYGDNSSVVQQNFKNYNAARIDDTQYVLAEGPDDADPTSVSRLMQATLLHPQKPINLFIAVGKTPNDDNFNPDFQDYFQRGQSCSAAEFFSALLTRYGKGSLLQSEDVHKFLLTLNQSNFGFYCFTANNTKPEHLSQENVGYAIHISTWPDHGVMAFSEANQIVLLLLALLDPNNVAHCRAGRGRSATLICARMLFQKQVYSCQNEQAVIKVYSEIIHRLRFHKPGCMYLASQFVLGLELAAGMAKLYLNDQVFYNEFSANIATPNNDYLPFKLENEDKEEKGEKDEKEVESEEKDEEYYEEEDQHQDEDEDDDYEEEDDDEEDDEEYYEEDAGDDTEGVFTMDKEDLTSQSFLNHYATSTTNPTDDYSPSKPAAASPSNDATNNDYSGNAVVSMQTTTPIASSSATASIASPSAAAAVFASKKTDGVFTIFSIPGKQGGGAFFKNPLDIIQVKAHITRCLSDLPLPLPDLVNNSNFNSEKLLNSLEYLHSLVESLDLTLRNTGSPAEESENKSQFIKQFVLAKEHIEISGSLIYKNMQTLKMSTNDVLKAQMIMVRILLSINQSLQNKQLSGYAPADLDVSVTYLGWKDLFDRLYKQFTKILDDLPTQPVPQKQTAKLR